MYAHKTQQKGYILMTMLFFIPLVALVGPMVVLVGVQTGIPV